MISLFARKPTSQSAGPIYQAQMTDYNERYGIHKQNADRWRFAFFATTALLAWSVTGNIWQGTQSKIVPYVVERDHLGDEVAVGLLRQTPFPDPLVVQSILARWIYDVRLVSTDMTVWRHLVFEAYGYTNQHGPAKEMLDKWFKDTKPWERAQEVLVIPTVLSLLPDDNQTLRVWEAVWREDTMTRSGVLETSVTVRARITVMYKQASTKDEIIKNPSGAYVEIYSWDHPKS